ncbi:MAG: flippase-like domain-containing protein [Epsilonproteobacteria bacterium]|nr:TIGR00374 family protein [Campylobacterota bacterium]NPA57070.1 flippase-like domain-containing protein [Campylobacterota bacterium]
MSRLPKVALKLSLSLLLLVWVFREIDFQELLSLIGRCSPFWLLLAFLAFNLSQIVSAIRFNYYLKGIGSQLSLPLAIKLYYVGMFYNLFLPGGIGGDGYKIYLIKRYRKGGVKELLQIALLDRLSGLVALLFLGSLLFLFSDYSRSFPLLRPLALAGGVAIYPVALSLHRRLFPQLSRYLREITLLALAVQLLQLLAASALIEALPHPPPLVETLTLFLLSSIVAVLPLTIGGIGAREATFLYGFKLIGYDPAVGVAFSFLFFLLTALSSALGLLFINISDDLASKYRYNQSDREGRE